MLMCIEGRRQEITASGNREGLAAVAVNPSVTERENHEISSLY